MNLIDDEVLWISTLLHTSKSKLISEYPEVYQIKQKIHNKAREIRAKKAQSVILPGKWS